MTVIIGGIEGVFVFSKQFPYFAVASQVYWVGIIFVTFALLFAILGYLSELNARDDLLTPLRRELVGFWQVRSQSWRLEEGKIEFGWVVSYCTIGIEQLGGKAPTFRNRLLGYMPGWMNFAEYTRKPM
jgi:hypothetical protein